MPLLMLIGRTRLDSQASMPRLIMKMQGQNCSPPRSSSGWGKQGAWNKRIFPGERSIARSGFYAALTPRLSSTRDARSGYVLPYLTLKPLNIFTFHPISW